MEKAPQTVKAAHAMLGVIESWGIKNIYGLPGGSLDSTMDAIYAYRDRVRYIGVRHEEAGALAAVAEAKHTGKIAVTLGSAGPGAAHLINGLYDAKIDNIPVLAIIGQVPTELMNRDYFQELPENPMFADVSVYNRTVMTANQLPDVVDTAIRTAYAKRGPAVVVLPKDLGWEEITPPATTSANAFVAPQQPIQPREEDVEKALDLILAAKRPTIYFGQGVRGAGKQLKELSDLLQLPLVSTYLGKGIIPDDDPAYMISTGRVATKPGVDTARAADLMVFLASNYEFGRFMFNPEAKFIDVNINPMDIGSRHATELGIMADGTAFLDALLAKVKERAAAGELPNADVRGKWFDAAKENKKQWSEWIKSRETSDETRVWFEPLYKAINDTADDDAIFGIDVGNVNIATARFLKFGQGRTFSTSPLYATMGYGMPAAIAAKLAFPDKEVWSLSGDGGFAMNMQELVTQAVEKLPIINVVFTNESLGFIEAEQDDTNQPHSGITLEDVDFATVARGMGVEGYTVRTRQEFEEALKAVKGTDKPVLIDVKITNNRLLPVEAFPLNAADRPDFEEFRASYGAEALDPFGEIMARNNVEM